MSAGISSVLPSATYAGALTEFWSPAGAGGGGGGSPGVTQIVAGNNITISPADGEGVVTINSTASGASGVTELLAVGAGIAVSAPTGIVNVSNTGVTSIVAGPGVTVSGATGEVTVSSPSNALFLRGKYVNQINGTDPCLILSIQQIGQIVTVVGRFYDPNSSGSFGCYPPPAQAALLPVPANQFSFLNSLQVSGTTASGAVCTVCANANYTLANGIGFSVIFSGGGPLGTQMYFTLTYISNDFTPSPP